MIQWQRRGHGCGSGAGPLKRLEVEGQTDMKSWRPMRNIRSRNRRSGHGGAWAALLALGCVCAVALGVSWQVLAPRTAAAGRAPGGRLNDPVVRAVDIAGPSIVRIATLYTAQITLNLCGQNVTLPASGRGYTLGASGSGAFISASGDILTADHVVDVPKELLDQTIFQEQQSASDIANVLNTNPGCHASQPITANDVAAGYVQFAGIPYTVHYSSPRRLVWQSTAFTGPVSSTSQDSTLAGLLSAPYQTAKVLATSSVDDNDVAIVHVDMSDTPSIQLDNSASVAVEDQLTIIGYPGNGDVTDDGTDLLTPSVNVITVSAMKTGDNGEQLIQVGGNIEHGDSGGPALDAQGHIVGIVSFAFVGPDSPGSTAFLRSSNSVQSLLSTASVNTTPGAFEKQWEAAFADYAAGDAGHWHRAARELDSLSGQYPEFHGVQPYKDYANAAAAVEAAPADARTIEAIATGALALLALVIALVVVLVLRGRRGKRRLAYAPAGQVPPYAPSYNYGYPPPAYYGPPSQQLGGHGPPSMNGGYMAAPAPDSMGWGPTATNAGFVPPSLTAPAMSQTFGQASSYPAFTQDTPMGHMPGHISDVPVISRSTGNPVFAPDSQGYTHAMGGGQIRSSATSGANGTQSGVGMAGAANGHYGQYGQGYCTNGHPMPPGEHYCAQCGAPRWTVPPVVDSGHYPDPW